MNGIKLITAGIQPSSLEGRSVHGVLRTRIVGL